MDTLAKRLQWARDQKKWTQEVLANEAGVSQGTIGNLEAGIRDTARKIASIARALEVDVSWLADGKGPMPPDKDSPVEAKPPRSTRMVLAYEDEQDLFDLYRRTDDRGRDEVMREARRQAARAVDAALHKGKLT